MTSGFNLLNISHAKLKMNTGTFQLFILAYHMPTPLTVGETLQHQRK